MHAATLKSPRLQRAKELLSDGEWHSTLEVSQKAYICAVNSCMVELRANGIPVECQRRADRFYYRIPRQEELL